MKPILFELGSIKFYSFGLVILASLIMGCSTSWLLLRQSKTKVNFKTDVIILTGLMGIIGARLTFFLLNFYRFRSFEQMFYYPKEGLVAWGGILAASLFCFGLMIKYEDNLWVWLDNLILGFLAGFLSGNIIIDLLSKNSLLDYRLFWIFVTLVYLLVLKIPRIGKDLHGYLYFFGLLSFSLMQISLPYSHNRNIVFLYLDLNQIFSLFILILISGFLISITSKKSWRLVIWGKILKVRMLPHIMITTIEKLLSRMKNI